MARVDYLNAYKLLADTSQHVQLVTETVNQHILPQLDDKEFFLDVGAGPGTITRRLADYFNHTTIVEPENTPKENYPANTHIHHTAFEEFKSNHPFNFVLCSHVLYSMPPKVMKPFLKKLMGLIDDKGYGLIVFMADEGPNHEFHQTINPDYINSGQIKTLLHELAINYELVKCQNKFHSNSKEQMLNLLRFFAVEDCKSALDAKTENIIEEHLGYCQLSHDDYHLVQTEDHIIIKGQH